MVNRLIYSAVAAALVLAGWLLAPLIVDTNPCEGSRLELLNTGRGETMTAHPRWSGCFDVTQPDMPRRIASTELAVRGAIARFELAARRRSAAAVSDLGVALALAGEVDRAITTLDTVLVERQDSAALANRAAARLLRAAATHNPYQAMLALDDAIHASLRNPGSLAAYFNEALALTLLDLTEEADAAWRAYLERDPQSRWSDRARAYLEDPIRHAPSPGRAFEQAPKQRRPDEMASDCQAAAQGCREYLEEQLLPAWGRAVLAADSAGASTALSDARTLAEVLSIRSDRLDQDAIRQIEQASVEPNTRLVDMAAGCDAYGRARAAFETDLPSGELFAEAERRLMQARSPLAEWARASRIYAEFNTYDEPRLQALGPQLVQWAKGAADRGYATVAGRLLYFAALTQANRARYAPAEPLFAESLDALTRSEERDYRAATEWAIGNARFRLGNPDEGWRWFSRAFESLRETTNTRRRYVILLNAGYWLGNLHLDYAATRLLTAARDEGARAQQPSRVAESLLYRARAHARIGNLVAAHADATAAAPGAPGSGQWGASERSRMEYLAVLADIELTENPAHTMTAASEALAFYEGRGFAARVAELHLLRGRAARLAGDHDLAARDFEAGIETYERYRRGLTSDQQRVTSQEVVWDLYEESIALAAATDPRRALDLAERSRARTLIEAVAGVRARASSPLDLEGWLGLNQRVLYFAVMEDELLTWVIGRGETRFVRQLVDRVALERLIRVLADALGHDAPPRDWQPAAEQLYALLIAPVRAAIPSGAALIVVPDGALNLLPFAALRDPGRQQFLVDEHEIAIAPSATILLEALATGETQWHPPARVLVAAAPAPAAQALPSLAGVRVEATRIAALYPHAELLSDERATRASFIVAAPFADVVHFAGHSVATPGYPLLARLEFSPEPGASGSSQLTAEQIAGLRLARTELVVLAACETAAGPVHRGEGVLSLARPFLVAGVRSVIATLWDINDVQATAFVTALHGSVARGRPPAAALREAQLQMRELTPASVWAAFITIGVSDLTVK